MDENLLPKEGSATSSYKVAALSALAPIGLAVVLVIGAAFTPHADVRAELLGLLKYLVSAGIIGGAGVAVQYVYQRGKVSVAKLETYKAINAAPSAQSVTTTTEVK